MGLDEVVKLLGREPLGEVAQVRGAQRRGAPWSAAGMGQRDSGDWEEDNALNKAVQGAGWERQGMTEKEDG